MEYVITFRVVVNASNEDDAETIAIQQIAETTNYTMTVTQNNSHREKKEEEK